MGFGDYFSSQARRPSGPFGRHVMPLVFDRGNAFLNGFVDQVMAVEAEDRILEIGCGTGRLIQMMAKRIASGWIEGIDFSSEMVAIARRRNRRAISAGTVTVTQADIAAAALGQARYTKACSVNTLYFWKDPRRVLAQVLEALAPGGRLVLGFEDRTQLRRRNLSAEIFHIYAADEVRQMLAACGAAREVSVESRRRGNLLFHCAVATR